MSLARVLSSGLTCHACRHAIVRSFISPSARPPFPPARVFRGPSARAFAWTSTPRNEGRAPPSLEGVEDGLESPLSESAETEEKLPFPEANQTIPVPWYLQAQRERDPSKSLPSLPKRELIPDLPPNPPPLLPEILHHVSISLGLDDLLLLDLRHLDPPPALGSKLIMIIGTARSEKHLHVSADRFCRWLRRDHGLKPNAGGLLGRQELKIKLRRKAKRMRLLANAGGQEPEGAIDDGIRTGWICCTVGRIEAHPDDVPATTHEKFVGFRNNQSGVNLVVQMFTEEKRAEIDLETLWGGVVKTHERENKKADEKLQELDSNEENEVHPSNATEGSEAAIHELRPQVTGSNPSQRPSFTPVFTKPPTISPAQDRPSWTKPRPGKSDPFPSPLEANPTRQHVRRIHTERQEPPAHAPPPSPSARVDSAKKHHRPAKPTKILKTTNPHHSIPPASRGWPWSEHPITSQPVPSKDLMKVIGSNVFEDVQSLTFKLHQARTLRTALKTSPDHFSAEQRDSVSSNLTTIANVMAFYRRNAILDSISTKLSYLNAQRWFTEKHLDLHQVARADQLRMASKSPGLDRPGRVRASLRYLTFVYEQAAQKWDSMNGEDQFNFRRRHELLKYCQRKLAPIFEGADESEQALKQGAPEVLHPGEQQATEEQAQVQTRGQEKAEDFHPAEQQVMEEQAQQLDSQTVGSHSSPGIPAKENLTSPTPPTPSRPSSLLAKPKRGAKQFHDAFNALQPALEHWERVSGENVAMNPNLLVKKFFVGSLEDDSSPKKEDVSPEKSVVKRSPSSPFQGSRTVRKLVSDPQPTLRKYKVSPIIQKVPVSGDKAHISEVAGKE